MKKVLLILILVLLTSCRCETDFEIIPKSTNEEIINVSSNIWESQYEYLNIDLTINSPSSLFVKDIIIETTTNNGIFPYLDHYQMITSYVIENKKLIKKQFKEIYTENQFKNLPIKTRKTSIRGEKVFYSITYTNKKKLDINNYSAKIKVILLDENKEKIIIERFINFSGKRNCYFGTH